MASRSRSVIKHPHEHYNGAQIEEGSGVRRQSITVEYAYSTGNTSASRPPQERYQQRASYARHSTQPPNRPPTPPGERSRVRNSLHKPHPTRKLAKDPSSVLEAPSEREIDDSMAPPPRPTRLNTETLHDLYTPDVAAYSDATLQDRRSSLPSLPMSPDAHFLADANEPLPSPDQPTAGSRSRSGTSSFPKNKKGGMLSFMSGEQAPSRASSPTFSHLRTLLDFLNTPKKPEISTPYDPVHLTHVGFNSSTGEFTGLPKEWQQLLQESGISRLEQERNPQAVMEIVKFYQEGRGEVWDKMGGVHGDDDQADKRSSEEKAAANLAKGFQNPVREHYSTFDSCSSCSEPACSVRHHHPPSRNRLRQSYSVKIPHLLLLVLILSLHDSLLLPHLPNLP